MKNMFEHADEMIPVFRAAYRENPANINYAIQVLKDCSCSKITTISILKIELNVSLNEANSICIKSRVWG
jgi:hypothetical protein